MRVVLRRFSLQHTVRGADEDRPGVESAPVCPDGEVQPVEGAQTDFADQKIGRMCIQLRFGCRKVCPHDRVVAGKTANNSFGDVRIRCDDEHALTMAGHVAAGSNAYA